MVRSNRQVEIVASDNLEISLYGDSENCKAKANGAKISPYPFRSRSGQYLKTVPQHSCGFNEHTLSLNMFGPDMFSLNRNYPRIITSAKRAKYQIPQSLLTVSNDLKRSFYYKRQ